ncbi:DUF4111 domain-containing protein [Paenibacillus sp. TRM 82003]|nr:DUF4111 domain-containing protein [Paenibacillus sp. TRM 82003]
MSYGWGDAPAKVRDATLGVVDALRQTMGDAMVGVYLHGSLAMGSFQTGRSDIDLVAVVAGEMTYTQKTVLAKALLRLSGEPFPVELHIVEAEALRHWKHPCPFVFHYSEAWRGRFEAAAEQGEWNGGSASDGEYGSGGGNASGDGNGVGDGSASDGENGSGSGNANDGENHRDHEKEVGWRALAAFAGGVDADLAAHARIVRERGVALQGRAIEDTFPLVPDADMRASVLADVDVPFRDVSKQPVYYVLNLLRAIRFATDGAVLSKEEAGIWGFGALPFHIEVVADALSLYRRPAPRESLHFDVEPLQRFLRSCRWRLGLETERPSNG